MSVVLAQRPFPACTCEASGCVVMRVGVCVCVCVCVCVFGVSFFPSCSSPAAVGPPRTLWFHKLFCSTWRKTLSDPNTVTHCCCWVITVCVCVLTDWLSLVEFVCVLIYILFIPAGPEHVWLPAAAFYHQNFNCWIITVIIKTHVVVIIHAAMQDCKNCITWYSHDNWTYLHTLRSLNGPAGLRSWFRSRFRFWCSKQVYRPQRHKTTTETTNSCRC